VSLCVVFLLYKGYLNFVIAMSTAVTTDYANQFFWSIIISTACGSFIIFALILIVCILAAIRRKKLKLRIEEETESANKEKIDKNLVFINKKESRIKSSQTCLSNQNLNNALNSSRKFTTLEDPERSNKIIVKEREQNKENQDKSILIAKRTPLELNKKFELSKSVTSYSEYESDVNSRFRNQNDQDEKVEDYFESSNKKYENFGNIREMNFENNLNFRDFNAKNETNVINKKSDKSIIKTKINLEESYKNNNGFRINNIKLIQDGNLKYGETLSECTNHKTKNNSQYDEPQKYNEILIGENSFVESNQRYNQPKNLKNKTFGTFKKFSTINEDKITVKNSKLNEKRENLITNRNNKIYDETENDKPKMDKFNQAQDNLKSSITENNHESNISNLKSKHTINLNATDEYNNSQIKTKKFYVDSRRSNNKSLKSEIENDKLKEINTHSNNSTEKERKRNHERQSHDRFNRGKNMNLLSPSQINFDYEETELNYINGNNFNKTKSSLRNKKMKIHQ
jgi:hypothetical protein